MKRIQFKDLPANQQLTIVTLGDYFDGNGPGVDEVLTKKKFIKNQLDGGDISFEEFMETSGDGADNFVVLTIWNNQIVVVTDD